MFPSFQVYHTRDQQYGTVFVDKHERPMCIRWSCGYTETFRIGRYIRVA